MAHSGHGVLLARTILRSSVWPALRNDISRRVDAWARRHLVDRKHLSNIGLPSDMNLLHRTATCSLMQWYTSTPKLYCEPISSRRIGDFSRICSQVSEPCLRADVTGPRHSRKMLLISNIAPNEAKNVQSVYSHEGASAFNYLSITL